MARKRKFLSPGTKFSEDALARRMRENLDVRSRPARARVSRTEEEEKKRLTKAWTRLWFKPGREALCHLKFLR